MSAREMIEQEWDRAEGMHGFNLAAERVIDRLQRRVEELEDDIESMVEAQPSERERYRDRLDMMVAAQRSGPLAEHDRDDWIVPRAIKDLAAIDAAVENRK